MLKEVHNDVEKTMEESIAHLEKELSAVRTGRASTALLDSIRVDAYDGVMPINQMASISAPDPRMIVVQPWDISLIGQIEKAIQRSDLGITPANDGKVIRLNIPPLTEESRLRLVRKIKKLGEDARIAIRNHRRTANTLVKELKEAKEIGEDEMHRSGDEIQEITDRFIKRVDALLEAKEKEITTI